MTMPNIIQLFGLDKPAPTTKSISSASAGAQQVLQLLVNRRKGSFQLGGKRYRFEIREIEPAPVKREEEPRG